MRNGQPDRYFAIRYYVNGKQREEGVGWGTEGWNAEKASVLLGEIRAGIRTGKGPQSLAERREKEAEARDAKDAKRNEERLAEMTLEEFFYTVYIPQARKEKRSWHTDEQRIKSIAPDLISLPLRAVRPADVQSFLDRLTDTGAAPATVKQYMSIIRRAFYLASELTTDRGSPVFTGKNPATGLRLPAVHNSRERYLTAKEVEQIAEAAGNLRSPDLLDSIVLSLNTGLRLGEIIRLRWLDVDMVGEIVTVPDETQRKPGGKVPLNFNALAVFRRRKEKHDMMKHGELVFPPPAGGRVRENLSHAFKRVADKVGLNDGIADPRHRIVFHSLRHTFASWLALAGTDIYRIKTLMRHSSINMTMRYAHLIPDATRDAVHNLCPPKES
jgi:integrase